MFLQFFTVSALLLLLLARTTATVTGVPPECDGLGITWSQIGNNDTITASAIEFCGTFNSPYGCNLGCFEVGGCINVNDGYSILMHYKFDEKVHNVTTVPCMEHFNQTKESCNKGGRIDFMIRDDAVLNGTRFHGNFTTRPYPDKCQYKNKDGPVGLGNDGSH